LRHGDGVGDFLPFLLLVNARDDDDDDEVGLSISSIGRVTETGDDEDLDVDDDEKNDSRSSIGRVTEICDFVVDGEVDDDVDCGTGEVVDDVCCGAEKNENPSQRCSFVTATKATSTMER